MADERHPIDETSMPITITKVADEFKQIKVTKNKSTSEHEQSSLNFTRPDDTIMGMTPERQPWDVPYVRDQSDDSGFYQNQVGPDGSIIQKKEVSVMNTDSGIVEQHITLKKTGW